MMIFFLSQPKFQYSLWETGWPSGVKLANMWRPLCAWNHRQFLSLRHFHIHQVQFGFSCSDTGSWGVLCVSFCSIGLWFSAFSCLSNFAGRERGAQFPLWPPFPYGSKRNYWFFSLLSFLPVSTVEWWLLSSSCGKPGCSSLHARPVTPWFSVVFILLRSGTHVLSSTLGLSLPLQLPVPPLCSHQSHSRLLDLPQTWVLSLILCLSRCHSLSPNDHSPFLSLLTIYSNLKILLKRPFPPATNHVILGGFSLVTLYHLMRALTPF